MSDWKNVQYKDGKMRTSEGGGGGGSSTFAGLDDVSFNNVQNGQIPKYNSTTQKWENSNESGGGGTVTDVQVDGVSVVNQQGVAEIETPNAGGIEYNNQQSGLSATDVQSAIDELAQGSGGSGVEDVEVNGTSVVNAQNVAEITSYKEVTLAEYQALPSSKTSDGVMYCIKDIGGANQFPPLIYSDEEREIGVWRDGKPLYEKTFSGTTASDFVTIEFIVDTGSDTSIKNYFGLVNGARPFNAFMDNNSRILTWVAIDGHRIANWAAGGAFASLPFKMTVQYTKTTDTAGSGTWNQQGGYAHHYSTSEKVIGTWIDGKPLYEKTVHKTFAEMSWNGDRKIFQAHPSGSKIRHIEAIAYSSAWGMSFGMGEHNFAGSESSSSYLYLGMFYQNVCMGYTGSRSDFTSASPEVYCTVQYTKNSD